MQEFQIYWQPVTSKSCHFPKTLSLIYRLIYGTSPSFFDGRRNKTAKLIKLINRGVAFS